jgi:hypothetical protein
LEWPGRPLTYDLTLGVGARFDDLNPNRAADFVSLTLVDGGAGDKDGGVNGVIDDPSTLGFVQLAPQLVRNGAAALSSRTVSMPRSAIRPSFNSFGLEDMSAGGDLDYDDRLLVFAPQVLA